MSNVIAQADLSREDIELVKATVARGATDAELKLFLARCQRMGLDPLKPGHIHFVKYGNGPGTIIIGIDGFRSRASMTGKHTGTKRGVIRDPKGNCIGAWCEVYRSDWQQPAREEVSLSEYNTGKGNWSRMPETMIKKVAEVAALRLAFPDELGGIYSDDEMEQAKPEVAEPKPEVIEAKSRDVSQPDPGDFEIQYGTHKGEKLSQLGTPELHYAIDYWRKRAESERRKLTGYPAQLVANATAVLEQRKPKDQANDPATDYLMNDPWPDFDSGDKS